MKLLLGIGILTFVYVIGWHQLYGQFIAEWYKKYQNWLVLFSIPRILTFSIGIVMFTLLTQIYFNEKINLKTLVLIALSGLIVALQVIWK